MSSRTARGRSPTSPVGAAIGPTRPKMIRSFLTAAMLGLICVVLATPTIGLSWSVLHVEEATDVGAQGWSGFFADEDGSVHEADINDLAAAGATRGCNPPSHTLFCPQRAVSRGEMAALIRRILALPESAGDYFSDDETSIFEDDINAVTAAGIGFGCADHNYCASDFLRRDEAAEMLVRSFAGSDRARFLSKGEDSFSDDDGNRFEHSINRLRTAGVTKGCNPPSNDHYCPDRSLTRAEIASFFVRATGGLPVVRIGVPLDMALVPSFVPSELSPPLSAAESDLPVVYAAGCHVPHVETRAISCEFGSETGPMILLVGDSHAAQWVPAFRQLAEERGWRFISMTKSGCPYLEALYWNRLEDEVYVECQEWNENATAEVLRLRPDLLVTTSSVTNLPLAGSEPAEAEAATDLIRDGLIKRLTHLESNGVPIIVMRDTPSPIVRVPACLEDHPKILDCSANRSLAVSTEVQRQAVEIAGGRYIDMTDYICTEEVCPAVVGSLLVWRDNSHLSTRYSRALAPALGSRLGEVKSSP